MSLLPVLLGSLLAPPALAGDVQLRSDGSLRYIGSLPPDFQVDAEGTMVGQAASLHQRLRAGLRLDFPDFQLSTEWDLVTGQVAGDTWDIPGDADERRRHVNDAFTVDGFAPRRAALNGLLGPFQLEAGLVTSHWGMGMVANAGAGEPLFGRSDFGDRVLRVRMTTQPFAKGAFPLYLTLAGDRVLADDMAIWAEDQLASQVIFSTLYADQAQRKLGAYFVYRQQEEILEERTTRAWVADLYGRLPVSLGEGGWSLTLEAESAGILGTTDRATSYNSRDQLALRSAGAALRTSLATPEERMVAHLRGGFASGDGDSDDDLSSDFTFDRDFDVGMVLFDEVWGAIEAGASALLSDPEHAGQPPDGVDAVTTEGAFRRAVYLQPALQLAPAERVDLRLGLVVAWSTVPVAQAFYSYRAGGVPTNHLDQPTEGYSLGSEIDWALGYEPPPLTVRQDELRPQLLVQGGHALLSPNLADAHGSRLVNLFTLTARMRW